MSIEGEKQGLGKPWPGGVQVMAGAINTSSLLCTSGLRKPCWEGLYESNVVRCVVRI